MSRARDLFGAAAGIAIAGGALMTTAGAQQQLAPVVQQTAAESAAAPAIEDPVLVFEREVFDYVVAGRRDPFRPLGNGEGTGPLFDDLTLRMIIFSDVPSQSVALLADAAGKVHRVRRGDIIGNAQVQDIARAHVVFSVENLGVRRQHVLDLKKKPTQGA